MFSCNKQSFERIDSLLEAVSSNLLLPELVPFLVFLSNFKQAQSFRMCRWVRPVLFGFKKFRIHRPIRLTSFLFLEHTFPYILLFFYPTILLFSCFLTLFAQIFPFTHIIWAACFTNFKHIGCCTKFLQIY